MSQRILQYFKIERYHLNHSNIYVLLFGLRKIYHNVNERVTNKKLGLHVNLHMRTHIKYI